MLNQAERAAEPTAPMVISDTQAPLQSQTNGVIYDSKSEMTKEYKRAGVEEVGTEKIKPKGPRSKEAKAKHKEAIKASLYRAHSQMGFGAP
jgi:hypothetical protein